MIVTCIDSSALLRGCLAEGDLSLVEQAMSRLPAASILAAVETPCALAARLHRGLLTPEAYGRLRSAAEHQLRAITLVRLTADIRSEAVAIAERFLVRSLDALHLATAVVVARQQRARGNIVRFCTADIRQATTAIALLGNDTVDLVPPLPAS